MAHEKVYGICENKCREEVYAKSEVYTKEETDSKYILPVGAYITRFDAVNNGGMSYGTWEFAGTAILEGSKDGAMINIMVQFYKRTA